MEMNKDEADRCLGIARRRQAEGDVDGALRFARKSHSLYPSKTAEHLMEQLRSGAADGSASAATTGADSAQTEHPGLRHRHTSDSTANGDTTSQRTTSNGATAENIRAVKRVLACSKTDFYQILEVEKSANDAQIKKAYRKLALQLHPDKNSAPGADEAFKLISKAFTVLSDSDKRAMFDRHGADPESRASAASNGFYRADGTQSGFEAEISPEQLFNMFFGGGMGGFEGSMFADGPGIRFQRFNTNNPHVRTRQRQQAQRGANEQGGSSISYILQLLPLLLLLLFTITTTMFSGPSEPNFAFEPSYHYPSERFTQHRNVQYFVNERDLHAYASGSRYRMGKFEEAVEADYLAQLQRGCRRERSVRNQRMQRAQGWFGIGVDEDALKAAKNMPTPTCVLLEEYVAR